MRHAKLWLRKTTARLSWQVTGVFPTSTQGCCGNSADVSNAVDEKKKTTFMDIVPIVTKSPQSQFSQCSFK